MLNVGTNRKRKENTGVAREHIGNDMKTMVWRRNLSKNIWKHWFCVGSYGKRNENISYVKTYTKRKGNNGFAREFISQ